MAKIPSNELRTLKIPVGKGKYQVVRFRGKRAVIGLVQANMDRAKNGLKPIAKTLNDKGKPAIRKTDFKLSSSSSC